MAASASVGRPPARRARIIAPILAALAVSGCETMERMDYLDRFFEAPRTVSVAADDRPPADAGSRRSPAGLPITQVAAPMDTNDIAYQPGSIVAMEPRPNPPMASPGAERAAQPSRQRGAEPRTADPADEAGAESRIHQIVRRNQWLTRFWMELTPVQQARVEQQLQRGGAQRASSPSDPAGTWDAMGLSDRARLVFGGGGLPSQSVPPAFDDAGGAWARNP